MAHTTTCYCGKLYEESSEEAANDPNRACPKCFEAQVRLSNEIIDEVLREEQEDLQSALDYEYAQDAKYGVRDDRVH